MARRWRPESCDVTLQFPSTIQPGCIYTGTSIITYAAPFDDEGEGDGAPDDEQLELAASDSGSVIALAFHACRKRIKIDKIAAVTGKRALKVQSTTNGDGDGSDDDRVQVAVAAPDGTHQPQSIEVHVGFTGRVATDPNDVSGIYTCQVGGRGGLALLTHFEVTHARSAFPCPDAPIIRLPSWKVTLVLPKCFSLPQNVIGNTSVTEVKRSVGQSGNFNSFSFAKTSSGPLPAYVIAFAAFTDGVVETTELPVLTPFREHEGLAPLLVRIVAPVGTAFPVPYLKRVIKESLSQLEAFFNSVIPTEQETLHLLINPLMHLGGMEHHSAIFLNERLCGSSSCSTGAGGAKPKGASLMNSKKAEDDIARLVVHEMAHHWLGNAVGLPFQLKEGLCLLLEQCIGDEVLGKGGASKKSMLKIGGDASVCASHSEPTDQGHKSGKEDAAVLADDAALRGRELTGKTYNDAVRVVSGLVAQCGWDGFERAMQTLVYDYAGRYTTAEALIGILRSHAVTQ